MMVYVMSYFGIGLTFAILKIAAVGKEIDSNQSYIKFKTENPVRYCLIYKMTLWLGFSVNMVLWPVVIVGDWFIARKGKS